MACQSERTNALVGSPQPILVLAHICKNTSFGSYFGFSGESFDLMKDFQTSFTKTWNNFFLLLHIGLRKTRNKETNKRIVGSRESN